MTNSEPSNCRWHPGYSSSDSDQDIVLQSKDGVRFHVHKLVLKLASDVFDGMFKIPKADSGCAEDVVDMEEQSDVLAVMLDIIYPHAAIPQIQSSQLIARVVAAADKFDMTAVLSVMHFIVSKELDAGRMSALDAYTLACQQGWDEVAKTASGQTLSINLADITETEAKNMGTTGFWQLQRLHRRRRDALFAALELNKAGKPIPNGTRVALLQCMPNETMYTCCIKRPLPAWTLLRYAVFVEMDKCSGGTVLRRQEFWDRPDFSDLWTKSEQYEGCDCAGHCKAMDKSLTKVEVLRVLDSEYLPKTI